MTTTPRGSPELALSQSVPETTVNEQIRRTEGGAGRYPIADRVTAPPGSCVDGAQYIIISTATGAFTGKEKQIAQAVGINASNGWNYRVLGTLDEGVVGYVQDEDVEYRWSGTAWGALSSGGGDVVGPSSAVDNHVAVFDGATGKLIKDGGVVLFANGANVTPAAAPATTAVGYLGCPQNTQNGTYTTVMGDAGKHIYHTSGSAHTWTIDSNANVAYPIGTILTFINENGGGVVTLAITSDTLRWGSSTGSRSLAANGTATAIKVASTTWRLTGDGIT